jgi:hypothetical protein
VICQARPVPDLAPESAAPPGADDALEFACPRCATVVTERLYGPCSSCRTTLRATLGGEGHELVEADYDPKMNVTPNAVAIKDAD